MYIIEPSLWTKYWPQFCHKIKICIRYALETNQLNVPVHKYDIMMCSASLNKLSFKPCFVAIEELSP